VGIFAACRTADEWPSAPICKNSVRQMGTYFCRYQLTNSRVRKVFEEEGDEEEEDDETVTNGHASSFGKSIFFTAVQYITST
jgi:hypothetical protein